MSDINDIYSDFVEIKKERKPKREPNKLVVINEEDLIRQVEIRPILYDKSLKGYRKSALRHQYWKEIAVSIGSSVEECRKRWRSLRDAFSKHYKLMARMEPVTYKRKKWIFFDQMSFIAQYLDNSNLEIEETVLEDFQDNSHDDILIHDSDSGANINVNDVNDITHGPFKTENNSITSSLVDDEANHPTNHHQLHQQQQQHHHQHEHQNDTTTIDLVDGNQFITRIFPSPTTTTQYLTLDEQDTQIAVQQQHQQESKKELQQQQTTKSNTLTAEEYATLMNIDGDDKFLLSCSPILKRLSRHKNALARLKIQQILYNIEFGGDVIQP
ncbi:putative uncharacterized protein DDB_G0272456 [Episyrphus balteatus]|uniref:putative uncharacterized protein DDB_G0272456 n=1 Tax=Episyrphus balteatus TaxID=286459 RepID=UPI00248594F8|nr:putative uncharacterized protein DDB_G0272456 [Episyrphus balteatus]